MLKRVLNNSIALFVVVVVMFLFVPLNPMILDILLVVNIGDRKSTRLNSSH